MNPRIELPQCIKLTSKIQAAGDCHNLESDQVLVIHEKKTIRTIVAEDGKNQDIRLSVDCPYRVKLQLENEKTFETMLDVANKEPLPKFLEVTKISSTSVVQVGDRLKVVIVEKGATGPSFIHF